jgi:GNAT superfamily N-acetyltransferase
MNASVSLNLFRRGARIAVHADNRAFCSWGAPAAGAAEPPPSDWGAGLREGGQPGHDLGGEPVELLVHLGRHVRRGLRPLAAAPERQAQDRPLHRAPLLADRPGLELVDGATLIGMGRFIRDLRDLESAEVAVTVADHWHGQGAGTALIRALMEVATQRGVRRFTALVLGENAASLAMLRSAATVTKYKHGADTVKMTIEL